MFPSRREKCQKVEHAFVCVCVYGLRTRPQADMVVIRITSLQWQSVLCSTMKVLQGSTTEERPKEQSTVLQSRKLAVLHD